MAHLKTSATRILAAALAASTLLPSTLAFAQVGSAYGPYTASRSMGEHRPTRVRHEFGCSEREQVRAPDIMTYDRKSGSEVMVGRGPADTTKVTGLNYQTGSVYSVDGDLTGPDNPDYCAANGETGSAMSVRNAEGGTVVRGIDGATGRRFEVGQGPGGQGPDFRTYDPVSGRAAVAVTRPDGVTEFREFGPHALACTRARLGGGARIGPDELNVGAKGGISVSLGDC